MKKNRGAALLAVGATVAATLVGGSAAGAINVMLYNAYSGGAYVKVGQNTLESDLSATATITGSGNQTNTGSAANASVNGLVAAAAVNTAAQAKVIGAVSDPDGYDIQASANLAGVSLLGGAIQIGAVTTHNHVVLLNNQIQTAESTAEFLTLKINGKSFPQIVPQNFGVVIPGIAAIKLNYHVVAQQDGVAVVQSGGVAITLLKPIATAPAFATIVVGPSMITAGTFDVTPTNHFLSGEAYGSAIHAKVGTLANVHSDPTALVKVPVGGTGGKTQTRTTATLNLAPLVKIGAVTNTAFGLNDNDSSDYNSTTTAKVAAINLFNGLIRADAIQSIATVKGSGDAAPTVTGGSILANLRIGGTLIPVNAAPNTQINLLGVATITLNQQIKDGHHIIVRAIDIVLTTADYGLPIGAEIELAVSKAGGI